MTDEWLDAAIAEKVMGWDVHFRVPACDDPTGSRAGKDHFYDKENKTIYLPSQWSPSTSEEAAFEVVRKMRKDGFSFKLWQSDLSPDHYTTSIPSDAQVSFICSRGPCVKHGNNDYNHHGAYNIEGETLCLAICRAALVAMKVLVQSANRDGHA